MIESIDPPAHPPVPASASDPSPALNRTALATDLAAFMAWTTTSARWKLLDRTVALLTGRSLTLRSSDVTWAALALPDDELELVLVAGLERFAGYLGLAPPAPPPGAAERAVLAHVLELVRAGQR